MFIIKKEVAEALIINRERVAQLFLWPEKIWEGVRSCFGAGYWRGDKPWRGDEAWRQ